MLPDKHKYRDVTGVALSRIVHHSEFIVCRDLNRGLELVHYDVNQLSVPQTHHLMDRRVLVLAELVVDQVLL